MTERNFRVLVHWVKIDEALTLGAKNAETHEAEYHPKWQEHKTTSSWAKLVDYCTKATSFGVFISKVSILEDEWNGDLTAEMEFVQALMYCGLVVESIFAVHLGFQSHRKGPTLQTLCARINNTLHNASKRQALIVDTFDRLHGNLEGLFTVGPTLTDFCNRLRASSRKTELYTSRVEVPLLRGQCEFRIFKFIEDVNMRAHWIDRIDNALAAYLEDYASDLGVAETQLSQFDPNPNDGTFLFKTTAETGILSTVSLVIPEPKPQYIAPNGSIYSADAKVAKKFEAIITSAAEAAKHIPVMELLKRIEKAQLAEHRRQPIEKGKKVYGPKTRLAQLERETLYIRMSNALIKLLDGYLIEEIFQLGSLLKTSLALLYLCKHINDLDDGETQWELKTSVEQVERMRASKVMLNGLIDRVLYAAALCMDLLVQFFTCIILDTDVRNTISDFVASVQSRIDNIQLMPAFPLPQAEVTPPLSPPPLSSSKVFKPTIADLPEESKEKKIVEDEPSSDNPVITFLNEDLDAKQREKTTDASPPQTTYNEPSPATADIVAVNQTFQPPLIEEESPIRQESAPPPKPRQSLPMPALLPLSQSEDVEDDLNVDLNFLLTEMMKSDGTIESMTDVYGSAPFNASTEPALTPSPSTTTQPTTSAAAGAAPPTKKAINIQDMFLNKKQTRSQTATSDPDLPNRRARRQYAKEQQQQMLDQGKPSSKSFVNE